MQDGKPPTILYVDCQPRIERERRRLEGMRRYASGACAGLVGTILGSWFVTAASRLAPGFGNVFGGLFRAAPLGAYRLYFVFLLLPAMFALAAAWRMRRFVYGGK